MGAKINGRKFGKKREVFILYCGYVRECCYF